MRELLYAMEHLFDNKQASIFQQVSAIMKDEEEGHKPIMGRNREIILFNKHTFGQRPRTEHILRSLKPSPTRPYFRSRWTM